MIAGVNGELSPDERAVLDHFFELFARYQLPQWLKR